ncbi:MAG: Maf family protein [Syntrophobacteraceae bacterium]
MFTMLQPLVLASQSPRRKSLLLCAGVSFEVRPSRIVEPVPPDGSLGPGGPCEVAKKCACLKAQAVQTDFPCARVLGADTIVVLEGSIFGKPRDGAQAVRMLQSLSGREHEVITGMCLLGPSDRAPRVGCVTTRVTFKALTSAEIEAYVKTGEPMDKAGAYGIQDRGAFLVRSIQGSYTNVVGLPLCETIDWLLEEGIIQPA